MLNPYRFIHKNPSNMKRYIVLTIVLALCLGCGGKKETHYPAQYVEADEYAVYDAIIREMYIRDGVNLVVIEGQTRPGCSVKDYYNEFANDLLHRLEVDLLFFGFASDALEDFEQKNKESHPLNELFTLPLKYALISKEEYDEIFRSRESKGWIVYHKRYPDSPGIISLSRAGFNPKMNKALVYVIIQREEPVAYTTGEKGLIAEYYCYYVILTKTKAGWTIEKKWLETIGHGKFFPAEDRPS
jgi:hypothetical protein